MSVFTQTITAGINDIKERISDGLFDSGNQYYQFGGGWDSAVRFTNITIPKGVEITDAVISFWAWQGGSGALNVYIKAIDVDNCAELSSSNSPLNSDKTTASVLFAIPSDSWSGLDYKRYTPNFASVIQEIIDRSSWASGNAIGICFMSVSSNSRQICSYEGNSSFASAISITYTTDKNVSVSDTQASSENIIINTDFPNGGVSDPTPNLRTIKIL
jgi:hypothetical protein